MNSISITIPVEYNALTRVSDMLHGMAVDLSKDNGDAPFKKEVIENFHAPAAETVDVDETNNTGLNEEPPPMNHSGAEIDSRGLPYDARIHTSGKIKKTKKDDKWKYARNVDPELIKTVESELRAAMAASPANPIDGVEYPVKDVSNIPAPLMPVASQNVSDVQPDVQPDIQPDIQLDVEKYLIENVEYTAVQLRNIGWTDQQMVPYLVNNKPVAVSMTFPELMAKITPSLTAGTITQELLLAAINKQGLASMPLLASRPDLIPAVHDELFSV